jgi:hypothetical protein
MRVYKSYLDYWLPGLVFCRPWLCQFDVRSRFGRLFVDFDDFRFISGHFASVSAADSWFLAISFVANDVVSVFPSPGSRDVLHCCADDLLVQLELRALVRMAWNIRQ